MQHVKGRFGRVYIVCMVSTVCMKVGESVDCLVLGDHVLRPVRLHAWLSRDCLRSEDVLFEKALLDKLI